MTNIIGRKRLQLFVNAASLTRVKLTGVGAEHVCKLCTHPIRKLEEYRGQGKVRVHEFCYAATVRMLDEAEKKRLGRR